MELFTVAGYLGTTIACLAYTPQIVHLAKERCSAGLSIKTYWMWLISSLLLIAHALSIHAMIFILQQGINLLAVIGILILGNAYEGKRCTYHAHPIR